jgi:hypothetical protein
MLVHLIHFNFISEINDNSTRDTLQICKIRKWLFECFIKTSSSMCPNKPFFLQIN